MKVITPTFYHILKDYGFDIGLCSIRIVEYILRHVIKYCNNEIYFLFKNDCQVKKGYNDSFLSTYSNFEYICRYGNVELLDYILKDYLRGFKQTRELRTEEEQKKLELLYKKELLSEESLWLKSQFAQTNAITDSIDLARKFGFEAMEAIKSENNDDLILIMKAMIERDF